MGVVGVCTATLAVRREWRDEGSGGCGGGYGHHGGARGLLRGEKQSRKLVVGRGCEP